MDGNGSASRLIAFVLVMLSLRNGKFASFGSKAG
jgi:hypothetical protein